MHPNLPRRLPSHIAKGDTPVPTSSSSEHILEGSKILVTSCQPSLLLSWHQVPPHIIRTHFSGYTPRDQCLITQSIGYGALERCNVVVTSRVKFNLRSSLDVSSVSPSGTTGDRTTQLVIIQPDIDVTNKISRSLFIRCSFTHYLYLYSQARRYLMKLASAALSSNAHAISTGVYCSALWWLFFENVTTTDFTNLGYCSIDDFPGQCFFYLVGTRILPHGAGYKMTTTESELTIECDILHSETCLYNDHLMRYLSAFWSSSRWPRARTQTQATTILARRTDICQILYSLVILQPNIQIQSVFVQWLTKMSKLLSLPWQIMPLCPFDVFMSPLNLKAIPTFLSL